MAVVPEVGAGASNLPQQRSATIAASPPQCSGRSFGSFLWHPEACGPSTASQAGQWAQTIPGTPRVRARRASAASRLGLVCLMAGNLEAGPQSVAIPAEGWGCPAG